MIRPRALAAAVTVALALVTVAPAGFARAGDRQGEILLVDATPATAGAAGQRCAGGIAQRIGKAYVVLQRRTVAAIMPKLGANVPAEILAWTAALLTPVRARRGDAAYDAIIVIDCRPEQRVLDVVVAPTAPGTASYRLRGVEIDAAALDWIVADLMLRAWAGFEI